MCIVLSIGTTQDQCYTIITKALINVCCSFQLALLKTTVFQIVSDTESTDYEDSGVQENGESPTVPRGRARNAGRSVGGSRAKAASLETGKS